jgi:hypothetical protein
MTAMVNPTQRRNDEPTRRTTMKNNLSKPEPFCTISTLKFKIKFETFRKRSSLTLPLDARSRTGLVCHDILHAEKKHTQQPEEQRRSE